MGRLVNGVINPGIKLGTLIMMINNKLISINLKAPGAFHFCQLTHLVGAIPPWLCRTLGDRSKVKCSQGTWINKFIN
jgi:hypothetical protein